MKIKKWVGQDRPILVCLFILSVRVMCENVYIIFKIFEKKSNKMKKTCSKFIFLTCASIRHENDNATKKTRERESKKTRNKDKKNVFK